MNSAGPTGGGMPNNWENAKGWQGVKWRPWDGATPVPVPLTPGSYSDLARCEFGIFFTLLGCENPFSWDRAEGEDFVRRTDPTRLAMARCLKKGV